ncbi:YGR125W, partial [Symbiodinium necroappetens]
ERLSDQAFEDMNFVPRGTLARLQPLCQVRNGLPHYTSLSHDQEPTLYLILRGAIAQFEQIGEDITVARSGKLHAEVKGFTGRGNKRLRARYPPGHIVGKTSFFLHGEDGLVDHKMLPMLQVSSRMSGYAEVWELRRSSWDKMPEDLKSIMEGLMLFQLADDRQHSLLIE